MPAEGPVPAPLLEVLRSLTVELDRARVPYALIGGLAVAHHGVPRATQDIDLLLSVPRVSLPGLLDRLREAGFDLDPIRVIRELGSDHLSQIHRGGTRVDLVEPVVPLFSEVLRAAEPMPLGDVRIRIASAEGLILLKLVAFRERDREDIRGIVAVRGASLDLDSVRRRWLTLGEEGDDRMRFLDSCGSG